MEQKTDRRVRKTKALLQSSLLELMKTKPLKNITIKELTDHADINRSTFYLHYTSIYSILEELEQGLLDQVYQIFDTYPEDYNEENSFSFISAMLQIVFDNLEICNILLDPKYNTEFIEKVQTLLDKKVEERLQHILGRDFRISSYLSSFYITGCMGMLRTWRLDENRPSPDDMAKICYALIMNTVDQMKHVSFEELSSWGV